MPRAGRQKARKCRFCLGKPSSIAPVMCRHIFCAAKVKELVSTTESANQFEQQRSKHQMQKPKLITGLFKSRIAAESALDAILKRGYSRDDISVLMSDATRNKEFAVETRSHAAGGAGIGGAVGGAVG